MTPPTTSVGRAMAALEANNEAGAMEPERQKLLAKNDPNKRRQYQSAYNKKRRAAYRSDEEYASVRREEAALWRDSHKESLRSYRTKQARRLDYQGSVFIRNLINGACRMRMSAQGRARDLETFERYVGCSLQQFQDHLKGQFTGEMAWHTKGDNWRPKFIVALNKFDMATEEGKQSAANWKNIKVVGLV